MFCKMVRNFCKVSVDSALKKFTAPAVSDYRKTYLASHVRKEAVRWLFGRSEFHRICRFRLRRVYDWQFQGVLVPNLAIFCEYVELTGKFL